MAWTDSRSGNSDIYTQRVTSLGQFAPGWPADGLPVGSYPSSQFNPFVRPDGFGGVLIAWDEWRNEATRPDIYMQRLGPDAVPAPGWPAGGAPVTRYADYQTSARISPDEGGAFVTWYDITNNDIYLQRLDPFGNLQPGWPADGLPISTLPAPQGGSGVVTDGQGGALVAWADLRGVTRDLYAQRVAPDGTILWAPDGVRMMTDRAIKQVLADGAGGAYLAGSTPLGGGDGSYFLQRFTGEGAIAPGWPPNGITLCLAGNERNGLQMVADGLGGVIASWSDYRNIGTASSDVYVIRIGPDGNRMPGWPENGLRVTSSIEHNTYIDLAPDGYGGAFVCWDLAPDSRVAATHIAGDGAVALGWPFGGLLMPGTGEQGRPRITADGLGGAIMAWEYDQHVRAQRFGPGGVVSTVVALEQALAYPDRIEVTWRIAEPGFRAVAQRRSETSDWADLADLVADGTGRLMFTDRDITAGTRYAYRLRYTDDGAERFSAESWVEPTAGLALALHGLRPNPSTNPLRISLTLPASSPASLEVFDLAGRRVAGRELDGAPGRQLMRIDGAALAPGVYVLRLTQAGQSVLTRGVVTE